MPNYCKVCGYVTNWRYIPRLEEKKGKCPICRNKLYKTSNGIAYYESRIEKSLPTYEDVVRKKYLKNITLDSRLSSIREKKEKERYKNNSAMSQNNSAIVNTKPIIECPYCHSTNTHKISSLSKAISMTLLGVFAIGDVSKQWHCNNCNSNF